MSRVPLNLGSLGRRGLGRPWRKQLLAACDGLKHGVYLMFLFFFNFQNVFL